MFRKFFNIIAIILLAVSGSVYAMDLNSPPTKEEMEICPDVQDKKEMLNGWYPWKPYQFTKVTARGTELTGMDVRLVHAISASVGVDAKYEKISWKQHQLDLKSGERDFAAGATKTSAREKFVYFSVPYRFEENSLFTLKNSPLQLNFNNIAEFLGQVRAQNYRLGVIDGFVYADPKINDFIANEENADLIFKVGNDYDNLEALLNSGIDGFLADRVVGAAVIIEMKAGDKAQEVKLNIKTPIHLMFSKKTVSLAMVDRFNDAIKKMNNTDEYNSVVKEYLYPVLLLQTINTQWFYIVGVIGTIAFAISGIAIAAKENTTVLGAIILAMLPSVGGGIIRDVMINLETVGIILTPSYIYIVIVTVLIGFVLIRVLRYYQGSASSDDFVIKFWNNTLVICDALGQAAFVVLGVSISIMGKIEPILLWGAFFAFLTANGGGIMRDILRKDRDISILTGSVNAEISLLWGFLFAMFLDVNSHNPDPDMIQYAVIFTVIGAFITRITVHYLNIRNLRFVNSYKE